MKSGVAPDNAPVAAARSAGRARRCYVEPFSYDRKTNTVYGMSLSRQATTQNLQVK